jgi:spermidine synthase
VAVGVIPLKVVARASTADGELELRQRGGDFLITIDGRVLMTSSDHRSEDAVATLACKELAGLEAPRVLIGGLGMAYTLRAALDALPSAANITVAELTAEVEAWCRGPLAPLTRGAALDPRVRVVIDDVARVIERSPAGYDAIILDLYDGPRAVAKGAQEAFYGRRALVRTYTALSPRGVLAIWSEDVHDAFTQRMADVGFATSVHRPGGSRAYAVYLGVKGQASRGRRAGDRT